MDRKQKLHYYKHIVKRHLNDIKKHIALSQNNMEKNYYINRYAVQLHDYAKSLNVHENNLERAVSKGYNDNAEK